MYEIFIYKASLNYVQLSFTDIYILTKSQEPLSKYTDIANGFCFIYHRPRHNHDDKLEDDDVAISKA